jgi:alkylated DNA repair protein (DNA oxidative demethylase)
VTLDLFEAEPVARRHVLGPQSVVLQSFASARAAELLAAIRGVEAGSPFRHMVTPGGFTMSVALTNCGALGWTSDRDGYRYTAIDPETEAAWPAMPGALASLAADAAKEAGFPSFVPDACLINRYLPGSRMTLHQDRNEQDFGSPIVSVSLGLPATFLFGGLTRKPRPQRVPLLHGDVVVWGGQDRLRFHGVAPVAVGHHPLLGTQRINLTLRKAG